MNFCVIGGSGNRSDRDKDVIFCRLPAHITYQGKGREELSQTREVLWYFSHLAILRQSCSWHLWSLVRTSKWRENSCFAGHYIYTVSWWSPCRYREGENDRGRRPVMLYFTCLRYDVCMFSWYKLCSSLFLLCSQRHNICLIVHLSSSICIE